MTSTNAAALAVWRKGFRGIDARKAELAWGDEQKRAMLAKFKKDLESCLDNDGEALVDSQEKRDAFKEIVTDYMGKLPPYDIVFHALTHLNFEKKDERDLFKDFIPQLFYSQIFSQGRKPEEFANIMLYRIVNKIKSLKDEQIKTDMLDVIVENTLKFLPQYYFLFQSTWDMTADFEKNCSLPWARFYKSIEGDNKNLYLLLMKQWVMCVQKAPDLSFIDTQRSDEKIRADVFEKCAKDILAAYLSKSSLSVLPEPEEKMLCLLSFNKLLTQDDKQTFFEAYNARRFDKTKGTIDDICFLHGSNSSALASMLKSKDKNYVLKPYGAMQSEDILPLAGELLNGVVAVDDNLMGGVNLTSLSGVDPKHSAEAWRYASAVSVRSAEGLKTRMDGLIGSISEGPREPSQDKLHEWRLICSQLLVFYKKDEREKIKDGIMRQCLDKKNPLLEKCIEALNAIDVKALPEFSEDEMRLLNNPFPIVWGSLSIKDQFIDHIQNELLILGGLPLQEVQVAFVLEKDSDRLTRLLEGMAIKHILVISLKTPELLDSFDKSA